MPFSGGFTPAASKSDYEKAVEAGLAFFGGGKQAAAAGATASLHISNPADSVRSIIIVGFAITSDTAADIAYHDDPASTGDLRTTHNHNGASPLTSEAELRAGSNVLSGGSLLSSVGRAAADITAQYQFPWILPPGQSFAVAATSGLSAISLYATAFWYEAPLG